MVPARTEASSGRRFVLPLLLLLATLAVFGQSVRFEFLNFDDPVYVTKNPWVRGGPSVGGIAWAFTTGHAANWHPLTWLSLMLDAGLGAGAPWPFHLTNLLLHAANVLLLFHVLARMTGERGKSFFVAALFAVHPIHVESVAWIAERKDVLSTLFWLLTMLAHRRYAEAPGARRLALVVLALAAGLMAKPMLVSLPFVLLLLDLWPLGRLEGPGARGLRPLVVEKLPLFALAAASCVVTFVVQRSGGAMDTLERLPLPVRVGNALVSYVRYIEKMLWPRGLAALYPDPRNAFEVWQAALAAVLLAAVTFLALHARRRRPYLTVGWLWYLGTLVPVIGLVQVGIQSMADRYTYVPLIGLFIVVAWGVPDLASRAGGASDRLRHTLAVLAAAVIVALACVAHVQVRHWRTTRTLFEHALEVTSENAFAESALGSALVKEGLLEAAIPHFHEALRIDPVLVEAQNALAGALFRQGQVEEAAAAWRRTLEVAPGFVEARANLAAALIAQGKIDEAIEQCRRVLRVRSDEPTAHTSLGLALLTQGKTDEAISELHAALSRDPEHATAHSYLAAALSRQGRTDEAVAHLREAVRIDPGFPEDQFRLGNALLAQGRSEEAFARYRETLRLRPAHVGARLALAVLQFQGGKTEEAVAGFERVLELEPHNAEARLNLGVALYKLGERERAAAEFRRVLDEHPDDAKAKRYLELLSEPGP